MLEMLKERKAALEAQGKKGFTLMEMLIVIAIIAILIAIAIPIFTAQLNNAKHAADEANGRSIYAIAIADYMDNNKYDNDYSSAKSIAKGSTGSIVEKDAAGNTLATQTFAFSDISSMTLEIGTDDAPTAPKVTVKSDNFSDVVLPDNPTGA